MIPEEIQQRIDYWLTAPFDEETKAQIRKLQKENPEELIDAFFTDLSFGTGGLRGIMGPGTCRLNIYTIRFATQGLANYLHTQSKGKPLSVVIGFDSRHHSQEFAEEAAQVLAGNQIHVYLLDTLRPTPYVSFACRFKKASAAIMITASHNPKEYNGYKVYWSDGAQVVHPHDKGIEEEVDQLKELPQVKRAAADDPLIERIDPTRALDADYLRAIAPLQHFPKESHAQGRSLKIVYTSLYGTGITLAPEALKHWGFSSITYVEEQIRPDGDFPTTPFPNPEYEQALILGIEQLQKTEGDILIANDPDADRIGIVERRGAQVVRFTGNEMAAICVEYLCQVIKPMPPRAAFVTTIVSTELIKAIAEHYHTECFEVLTGFKYIGEKIHQWEGVKEGYQFIFGAEESYGYLLGTHARDKDAIVSSCLIAEIALHAKLHSKTLYDLLQEIYQKYGTYREGQLSIAFNPGKEGMEQMTAAMQRLRMHPLPSLCGQTVVYIEDYQTRCRTYMKTQEKEPLGLPISDVLLYRLSDESRIVIRPSGTEPKLKIYASVHSKVDTAALCDQRLKQLLSECKTALA